MSLDEDFNRFANDFMFSASRPAVPREALEQRVVTTRTFGFPPHPFLGVAPLDDDPMPTASMGCCLYPAVNSSGNTPDAATLPSTLVFNSNTYSHYPGYVYQGGGNQIILQDGMWQLIDFDGNVLSESLCLVGEYTPVAEGDLGDLIEDQFLDNYSVVVSGSHYGSVYRTSLCEWQGVSDDGTTSIRVYYDADTLSWYIQIGTGTPVSQSGAYGGVQDGPTGTYGTIGVTP